MKKNNRSFIFLCLLCFILLVLTYSNHFQNAFQFDDSYIIVNNIFIRDLNNIPLFFKDARMHCANPKIKPIAPWYLPALPLTIGWEKDWIQHSIFICQPLSGM